MFKKWFLWLCVGEWGSSSQSLQVSLFLRFNFWGLGPLSLGPKLSSDDDRPDRRCTGFT